MVDELIDRSAKLGFSAIQALPMFHLLFPAELRSRNVSGSLSRLGDRRTENVRVFAEMGISLGSTIDSPAGPVLTRKLRDVAKEQSARLSFPFSRRNNNGRRRI